MPVEVPLQFEQFLDIGLGSGLERDAADMSGARIIA